MDDKEWTRRYLAAMGSQDPEPRQPEREWTITELERFESIVVSLMVTGIGIMGLIVLAGLR